MQHSAAARLGTFLLVPVLASSPACFAAGPPAAAPAPGNSVQLHGHGFLLPEGFTIDLAAAPPLVDRPITASFDEAGRLYVSDSSGSNDNVNKQLEEKPHRILRLEDSDGDGRFDKRTVFAEQMMFPEGTLWFEGSLYVAAPPSIWKLTDTDGDGVADQRVEFFQGKTLTGCANDLHGPYLGRDGWIYWCKGAFAEQTYERAGRDPLVTKAAHIFRCRPDGTQIEPVMTGGMDNPVDVSFTPGGERIFTTTFLQHPGGGLRDGLIHAVYGGLYGKVHGVLDNHPRTGDVMPPLVHLGPAAPCGLTIYDSTAFGREFSGNAFACCFNLRKVTRHALTPAGAALAPTNEDFLVSDQIDFHPTDVLEDADGSLIVVDTGGWYKLCCPTSQLWKPDILGAIYRIRRTDGAKVADPRGLKLDWEKCTADRLAERISDDRPAVRERAARALARRGAGAAAALAKAYSKTADASALANIVWALARVDHPAARAAVRKALHHADETVRQVACHAAGLWRDQAALPDLLAVLEHSPSQGNQRAAAEAIGRLGDRRAASALLSACARIEDPAPNEPAEAANSRRILFHSLTYAVIELGAHEEARLAFTAAHPYRQSAAIFVLDQLPEGNLAPAEILPLLDSPQPMLRQTAAQIVERRADWAGSLAEHFERRLREPLDEAQQAELAPRLVRFLPDARVQQTLGAFLVDPRAGRPQRGLVLRAMQQAPLKEVPAAWLAPLARTIADASAGDLRAASVEVVRRLGLPKEGASEAIASCRQMAADESLPAELRVASLAAVAAHVPELDAATFALLVGSLSPETPVATRSAAVSVLGLGRLTGDQFRLLADAFAMVGPLEADRVLGAYEQCADDSVGHKLIDVLRDSPALSALRVDGLRRRLVRFGPDVQGRAEELYLKIDADLQQQRQRLEELAGSLASGDVRRGMQIFHGSKAACAACHAMGYVGGNIGPDLTRIGGIRTERDLLESLAFPSASFVRSYEPVVAATKSGRMVAGLVRQETQDELVIATSATEQVRIPRDDVEEMLPGTASIMPAGLEKQLSQQDLADLIAFLRAAK